MKHWFKILAVVVYFSCLAWGVFHFYKDAPRQATPMGMYIFGAFVYGTIVFAGVAVGLSILIFIGTVIFKHRK